jgi:myo-inositol-1(or 4)-monophosphatase
VRAAGEVALRYFGKSPRTWSKANDSPVSEADIAVEDMLAAHLRQARPIYGWLSEEREDDRSRLGARRSFVVDPIDGTREFIAGGPHWTIPLAVVETGRPVAAVILAPALGDLYTATLGGGAALNDGPIRVSGRRELAGSRIAAPKRLFRSPPLLADPHVSTVFFASLAYRLARVADGRLDGAFAKPNAQDWDLAAADLLVHEAGGSVTDLASNMLRYDRNETGHPSVIAATPGIHAALAEKAAEAIAVLSAQAEAEARDSASHESGGEREDGAAAAAPRLRG